MTLKVEYHERYCGGMGCTPDGCPGHDTDTPAAIVLNGFRLSAPELDQGEPLSEDEEEDKREWKRWTETVQELAKIIKAHNP
jgi:hypothetical protein